MINIRNEKETDYRVVEKIIRKAFYNLYVPGCVEHYLAHIMRSHEDFILELDFVLELDGQVIGNIMYTKAKLVDENGEEKEILTFGPVCISPEYQRMGYGKNLMEYSFEKAKALGYDAIVIFGSPVNYVSRGFESCKKYNVCLENGKYPAAMMVKELVPNVLDGRKWFYYDSPVMAVDEKEAQKYDDTLEEIKKEHRPRGCKKSCVYGEIIFPDMNQICRNLLSNFITFALSNFFSDNSIANPLNPIHAF